MKKNMRRIVFFTLTSISLPAGKSTGATPGMYQPLFRRGTKTTNKNNENQRRISELPDEFDIQKSFKNGFLSTREDKNLEESGFGSFDSFC